VLKEATGDVLLGRLRELVADDEDEDEEMFWKSFVERELSL
jgi:hypothetical protein